MKKVILTLGIATCFALFLLARAHVQECESYQNIFSHDPSTAADCSRPIKAVRDEKTSDVERHGKELRAALEKEYRKLRRSNRLSGGPHGTDVTETVLPFILPGMTFDDAEQVLRAAGFTVEPRPGLSPPPNRMSKDWDAVVAEISPFDTALFQQIDLYVALVPKAPGEYTTIERVSGTIFISMP